MCLISHIAAMHFKGDITCKTHFFGAWVVVYLYIWSACPTKAIFCELPKLSNFPLNGPIDYTWPSTFLLTLNNPTPHCGSPTFITKATCVRICHLLLSYTKCIQWKIADFGGFRWHERSGDKRPGACSGYMYYDIGPGHTHVKYIYVWAQSSLTQARWSRHVAVIKDCLLSTLVIW